MPSHGWLLALFIATTHDLTASALSNTTVVSECGYEAGEHRNLFLPPDSTASFRYPTATEAACLSTGVEDRVYSELKKSIEFHDRLASFEDASTVIAAMFNVKQSETIAVINGRIFATKSDIKGVKHLQLLASVLKKHKISNIVYLHNFAASGKCSKDKNGQALLTTLIAKRDGRAEVEPCGVLVPNPYFDTVEKWKSVVNSMAPGKVPPFEKRKSTVFWRGSIGDQAHISCRRDEGNYDRFQAASLSISHPELFDVKLTRFGSGWDTSISPLKKCEPYDEYLRTMIGKTKKVVDQSWHEAYEYANYKMLLHLPGKTSGSYSRNLNHLWATGSAILGWNSTATEWYYPALVDGVTHLTVNYDDVVQKATRVLEDKELATTLRAGAAAIHLNLLCPDCLARHLAHTLNSISEYQVQHLVLESKSTFRAFLKAERVDCAVFSKMYMVRIHPDVEKVIEQTLLEQHPGDEYDPCEIFIRAAFHK